MKAQLLFRTTLIFINIYNLVHCQSDRYFLPEVEGKLAKGNFHYAIQICKQNGMLLATPDTEDKNKELVRFIEDNALPRIWISATDLADTGKFVFETNARPVTFTDWHYNQPDGDGEHCAELVYVYYTLKWNDAYCSNHNYVICEEVRIDYDKGSVLP